MNSQTMPISSVMAVYVTGFFKIVSVIVYIKIIELKNIMSVELNTNLYKWVLLLTLPFL